MRLANIPCTVTLKCFSAHIGLHLSKKPKQRRVRHSLAQKGPEMTRSPSHAPAIKY